VKTVAFSSELNDLFITPQSICPSLRDSREPGSAFRAVAHAGRLYAFLAQDLPHTLAANVMLFADALVRATLLAQRNNFSRPSLEHADAHDFDFPPQCAPSTSP
jgi:hypothetical protein